MKILHLCFSGGWGGLEKYSVNLAKELGKMGHDVHYACRKGTTIEKELEIEGIPHSSYSYMKYIDIPLMLKLRSLIKKGGFQIAHAHMSMDLGIIAPALICMESVKLYFSMHMIVPAPKKDIYHRLQYKRIKKIFALGAEGERSAAENLPVKPEQVMELPYGMEIKNYGKQASSKFREILNLGKEAKLIGILSRLEPLKGQMDAIRAMPKVLKRYPGTKLVLVGDETEHLKGTIKPGLEAEAKKLGLDNAVIFAGFQRDVPDVLNGLDLFVLPSHFESYSISVIEAKLCEIPLVAASSGGIPQNLGYGEFGILVEPKNHDSLASGILEVFDNPGDAKKRADAAKKNAVVRYDKERILKVISDEYES